MYWKKNNECFDVLIFIFEILLLRNFTSFISDFDSTLNHSCSQVTELYGPFECDSWEEDSSDVPSRR